MLGNPAAGGQLLEETSRRLWHGNSFYTAWVICRHGRAPCDRSLSRIKQSAGPGHRTGRTDTIIWD